MNIPEPITREEMYYFYLANRSGALPKPLTRIEMYLYYLCTNQNGATDDQIEQINENTKKIEELKEKSMMKDDFPPYNEVFDLLSEGE